MKLPQHSNQKAQEELSKRKFRELFDENEFQIRDDIPDAGIDFTVELIVSGSNTNWRFAVQLKSSKKIIHRTGNGTAFDAEVKNINYLIRYPGISYYFLYDVIQDSFFYTNVNETINLLERKITSWHEKDTIRIGLSELTPTTSINHIRNQTREHGEFTDNLKKEMAYALGTDPSSSRKVIIDSDGVVISEQRMLELIRKISSDLAMKGKWREISEWKERLTGQCLLSSYDSLIFGMAYFFLGELYRALQYFHDASLNIDQLGSREIELLKYYQISSKKALYMISEQEYNKAIKDSRVFRSTKLFIAASEIEKSIRMVKGTIDYDGLIQELEKISNHPDVDLNTKKICKSQFLLYSGYKNNNEYIVACHKMLEALQKRAFIPVIEALKMEVHKFYLNYLNWHKKLVSFSKVLESNGDWTHFFSLTVNESKVKYEFETFSQIIDGKFGIQESSSLSKKAFQELISRLKTCESHFSNTGNINNYATALLEHYGISCLLKFKSEAEEAYRSIMVLKETLQDKELINRIEFQLNGGLPHLVWFKNFGHEQ